MAYLWWIYVARVVPTVPPISSKVIFILARASSVLLSKWLEAHSITFKISEERLNS